MDDKVLHSNIEGPSPNTESLVSLAKDMVFGEVALSLLGGRADSHMLAICVEPGMGTHQLFDELLMASKAIGRSIRAKDLSASSPDHAARVLARIARELSDGAANSVVVLANIPPSDESVVARQARGLLRMVSAGATVVFSLAPEARQLLEALPACQVIWSNDLVALKSRSLEGASCFDSLSHKTGCIPSLVASLPAPSPEREGLSVSQSFYEAFGSLVSSSVRRTLSDEELRARLCMLLLGRGSADDLARALGRGVRELLVDLRVVAPLFGVSADLLSFECLCFDDAYALSMALPRLSTLCALFPDVLEKSEQVLVERGSFERCAALLRMFGVGRNPEPLEPYAAVFLDAGEVGLVRRIAEGCRESGRCVGGLPHLEAAVRALSTREPPDTSLSFDREEAACDGALALLDARRVVRALPSAFSGEGPQAAPLVGRLLAHRRACDLMASGRNGEALGLLVSCACEDARQTVSGALLELDLEMVRLLMCDGGFGRSEEVGQAEALLAQPALEGLSCYVAMLELVRHVMQGSARAGAEAAALASRSERDGDVLSQVIGLVMGVLCDLRAGALARANVKSLLAGNVARKAGLDYFARMAVLLGEVARYLLGERPAEACEEGPSDDLSQIGELVRAAMEPTGESDSEREGRPREAPRDALWLVRLLSYDMGEFSDLLGERMPTEWRRAAAAPALTPSLAEEEASDGVYEAVVEVADVEGVEAPIEVRLLGGFSVCVRGVRIPDWKLEQRGAKSMLEYLLLRGGTAKRYQIVEQVWPNCDYATGFNHAYQATSILRSSIGEVEPGLDPFVAGRASREVALDMGVVSSDVELFRAVAREASDSTDLVRALEMARRAEKIYAGDLYLPASDGTGYVASVRDELRELYADAMVAGGDAALSLGRDRTAVRLSSNALAANDLREDAVIVLIKALRASGRSVEADQQYRRYSGRLLRASGHAHPSSRLRQLMSEAPAPRLSEACA